jgi:hypothetical protein
MHNQWAYWPRFSSEVSRVELAVTVANRHHDIHH